MLEYPLTSHLDFVILYNFVKLFKQTIKANPLYNLLSFFSPLYPHRLRISVYFYHHYSVIHHEHSLASSSLCFLVVFFCPKIQRVMWDDCRKIHRFLLVTLKLPSKFFLSLPSSRHYCKEVSRP